MVIGQYQLSFPDTQVCHHKYLQAGPCIDLQKLVHVYPSSVCLSPFAFVFKISVNSSEGSYGACRSLGREISTKN